LAPIGFKIAAGLAPKDFLEVFRKTCCSYERRTIWELGKGPRLPSHSNLLAVAVHRSQRAKATMPKWEILNRVGFIVRMQ